MKSLHGKKALVTGAASGIGRAIALELAREGVLLWLVDIDEAGLTGARQELETLGAQVQSSVCDLADVDQLDRLADEVLTRDRMGDTVQILVNNAGLAYFGSTRRQTSDQWERLMQVNLYAPVRLTHRLMPMLCERGDCSVVNVCSYLGLLAGRRTTAYSTTKFGLVGFSLALGNDYPRVISVTAVCPGYVRTRLFDHMETSEDGESPRPPKWLTVSPELVARRAIRGMKRGTPIVTVSWLARLLWFASRLMPNTYYRLLYRRGWPPKRRKTQHRRKEAGAALARDAGEDQLR